MHPSTLSFPFSPSIAWTKRENIRDLTVTTQQKAVWEVLSRTPARAQEAEITTRRVVLAQSSC